MKLLSTTPPHWATQALGDINAFLLDHAACERKAEAVGLSFVVRYPDRKELLLPMIQFAQEELSHYYQVSKLCLDRNLTFQPDTKDIYVETLLEATRTGRNERFLDRLLISSLIEARGAERLSLIAHALSDPKLKSFYSLLSRSEERHHEIFLEFSYLYFDTSMVDERLHELLLIEEEAIAKTPFSSRLH